VTAPKTWGGRFTAPTDARVESFTESISVDQRLYREDLWGSQAHARMLARVGLLTSAEANEIVTALDAIGADIAAGRMPFRIELEDIHTHIERALIDRLGDLGRKLHTGRSRNDQVVTDLKLWVRQAIVNLDGQLHAMQLALLAAAERERDVVLPGYTHLQRAQPVLAGHYFCAYLEKFHRDRDRLADAFRRVNVLPLGAAALAGTSLPIDRAVVAADLRFASVARNSLDVSSDRDFVLDFLAALATVATHLSGWAEEWVLWSTTEFNFLLLPDAFCTGSSIMPHKKNPDVLELIRGKCGRVTAALQQVYTLLKGLPLAYNRDLQEDKAALFGAYDTVAGMLDVAAPLIAATRLRREVIAARLDQGFLDATTLMEFLIQQGVPMRSAHEAVGQLVRAAEAHTGRLADLPAAAFEAVRPGLSALVYDILGIDRAIAAFVSAGSTGPASVAEQLHFWQTELRPELVVRFASPPPSLSP
jgi:argininosuccinate lyase